MKKKNALVRSVALLAIVLLIGVGIGGTLAWLIDSTYEVKNTFTVGNIDIDLKETVDGNSLSTDVDGQIGNNQFKIIPGRTEAKDPTVIVKAGSENCYVFVQIDESFTTVNGVKVVDWTLAAGWTKLTGVDNVYYREYTVGSDGESSGATYPVLKDNQVTYSNTLTKADMDALEASMSHIEEPSQRRPSLTFKAYAVQKEGSADEVAAWAKVG